jgi:tetratricopeptide (TPR) repeat protein
VREHARKDETYQEWLQSSWSLIYDAFRLVEDPTLPQWWARCETFIPHLHSLENAWNDVFRGSELEVTQANVWLTRYFESRGRYDEAEALCKRVLEGMEKHLGNEHPDTLISMNNLANVYRSQGRYDEAEEHHKGALKGRKKHLGNDHPVTLSSMNNLASVY